MGEKIFVANDVAQGCKGGVVNLLGTWLKIAQIGPSDDIILDGDYTRGGKIAACVKAFQELYGLPQTGNFDAPTRAVFGREYGLNFDTIEWEMFQPPVSNP